MERHLQTRDDFMDPATLSLIQVGFSVAGKLFDYLEASATVTASAVVPTDGNLPELIQSSVSRFGTAIDDAVRTIIGKVEQDQLELLLSRTRNLSALVGMQRPDQALQYAWTLRESVDYAHNRLNENKLQWVGPYLAGNSIFLATLQYAGEKNDTEVNRFRQLVLQAKYRILDQTVPQLVVQGTSIPWQEISDFLHGTDAGGLTSLLQLVDATTGTHKQKKRATRGDETLAEMAEQVLEIATRHLTPSSKVFLSPNIPPAKRNGAEKKLTVAADPNDPLLALIDITVFGGAKDGFALFPTYFTYADIAEDAIRLEYADLPASISSSGMKVTVGSQKLSAYDGAAASALAAFLRDVRLLYTAQ
jgi:hypothetical protein